MDTKLEKLEAALSDVNVFNAGKKREEAAALLKQLLPEVESFQAEIQRYKRTEKLLKQLPPELLNRPRQKNKKCRVPE